MTLLSDADRSVIFCFLFLKVITLTSCGIRPLPKLIVMAILTGKISQIIGPVVDVHFNIQDDSAGELPAIHEALSVLRNDGRELIVEVQQHIGEDTVRSVAMDSTDGLKRGMEVICTGSPITMPMVLRSEAV